jgi:quinol monooxygenase YgiN
MLIVTVRFAVKKEHAAAFHARVRKQAADSLALEADCRHFDIAASIDDSSKIFLYEIYTDEAAFQDHLHSAHFLSFKADTQDWTESALVERWDGPWV